MRAFILLKYFWGGLPRSIVSIAADTRGLAVGVVLAFLAIVANAKAVEAPAGRISLPDSIRDVPASAPTGAITPHIARSSLTIAELNTPMEFSLSLKMRNFADLQARLARGELISPAEMAAKYWPLQSDYDAVANWLTQQGFTVSPDSGHLLVTASGTVAQVQGIFQVSFARVASDGADFSSAVTPPSVPAALAPALVGVNGLQPHLRKRPHLLLQPNSATGFVPPFYPSQIKQAYGAGALSLDGSGQTIAIVMSAYPAGSNATNTTNLSSFWTATNITHTGTYTTIAIGTGPSVAANNIAAEEACLDVEWSGAIAPGANIRLYGTNSLSNVALDQAYQKIYADAIAHPEYGLHVVSLSYGGSETSSSQLTTDNQLFAQLLSAGITVFASSGDDGSSVGAESPASDPNVTSVGGTSIFLDSTTGAVTSETAWSGSGGNSSGFFPRPSWQSGIIGGVNTTNYRLVPDISAPADPSTGCLIVWNNNANTTVGGTSWSAPTWAGFAALINQARAQNSAPPLGYLNPKLYPLLGSSSFRDITSGSNGGFSAGSGYDLVTGIGVPVFPNLLNALIVALDAPANIQVDAGQNAVFSCNIGNTTTTFLWQRHPAGNSTWANLTDNATYSGVTTANLTINAATGAMSGDQFRCFTGIGITPGATLVVIAQPLFVSTLAGQAGVPGTSDGQGAEAQFNFPNDVALDTSGNIFVADTNNNAIRKITPSGNVTTFAGTPGAVGFLNLNGTAARFNFVNSLDFDSGGNIYVADSNNNVIRKITPAGNVTTFAGSALGTSGNTNGNSTNAKFNFPAGLAVATNGNLYIADSNNNLIRKITPAGNVTTLAGNPTAGFANGNGTSAHFDFPAAVAVDSTGNIFVADANNNIIRKITPSGNVTTFAGSPLEQGVADGPGTSARFNYPSGIAVDSADNLYITDTNNNAIRKITPSGNVSTIAGQAGVQGSADGVGSVAQFNQPYGVVINNTTHVIYIADLYNHTIRQIQIPAAPQLLSQSGNRTVLLGQAANFTVTASGVPLPAYQWQRLPVGGSWANLTDDDTYSGSITATLVLNATTAEMSGDQFQCLITNAVGNSISVPATLTIYDLPAFTLQPADSAVSAGDPASFTATATGVPSVSYQWQMKASGSTGWGNITDGTTFVGANTATLTINATDTTLSGAQFRVVASNGFYPKATSSTASLTVYPAGYQIWAANLNLSGANTQLLAKPFNDTIPNLVRYVMNLGANPAPGDLPTLTTQVINGTAYLTLSYNVLKNLVGEQVVPEYSYDLITWQPVSPGFTVQLADPNSHTTRYEAEVAIPANGTVFLRLIIQPTP